MKFDQLYNLITESRSDIRPPRGYTVRVKKVDTSPNGYGGNTNWYDCEVYHLGNLILSASGTMFEYKDQAKKVGISRAWDIFENRSEWS